MIIFSTIDGDVGVELVSGVDFLEAHVLAGVWVVRGNCQVIVSCCKVSGFSGSQ